VAQPGCIPMAAPDRRSHLLLEAGFTYDARPDVWFNVDAHRALGGNAMRGNTEEWLAAWLVGSERVHATAPSLADRIATALAVRRLPLR
jgi:hypothetical protein